MSYLNQLDSHMLGVWARLDANGLSDPAIGPAMPRPPQTSREFFSYWLDAPGEHCAAGFFEFERACCSQRRASNVLMVHYADLKADLDGEMRRISAFLDVQVDETIWPPLEEAATFEAIKRDGDILLAGMEHGFEGGHRNFLHKATNGRWKGEVVEADLARYRQMIEAAITPGLIAWLEGGRASAGEPGASRD